MAIEKLLEIGMRIACDQRELKKSAQYTLCDTFCEYIVPLHRKGFHPHISIDSPHPSLVLFWEKVSKSVNYDLGSSSELFQAFSSPRLLVSSVASECIDDDSCSYPIHVLGRVAAEIYKHTNDKQRLVIRLENYLKGGNYSFNFDDLLKATK
ncbi:MAG: hypothetical protein ACMXYF_03295 [Candidatus Woesearchaeota archaeon]